MAHSNSPLSLRTRTSHPVNASVPGSKSTRRSIAQRIASARAASKLGIARRRDLAAAFAVTILEDVDPTVPATNVRRDGDFVEIAVASRVVLVGRETESSGLHQDCACPINSYAVICRFDAGHVDSHAVPAFSAKEHPQDRLSGQRGRTGDISSNNLHSTLLLKYSHRSQLDGHFPAPETELPAGLDELGDRLRILELDQAFVSFRIDTGLLQ